MNIKVKHIIPIIVILFLIYLDYKAIKFVFFEIHTHDELNDSVYPFLLVIQAFLLTVVLLATISAFWNETLINTNKIKSQITNKLK